MERADGAPTRARRAWRSPTCSCGPRCPHPAKVLGIGLNYAAHVAETGAARPEYQVWFNKQRTCVIGPGEAIEIPPVSAQVDYEGELAMVIGRRCRHVPTADAPSVVAGFTVLNDVTVRDWQWRTPTWTLGKSFDTHGPTGPVDRHRRRDRRPSRLPPAHVGQRRPAPGRVDRRHDLLVLGAGRVPVHGVHPRARGHHLHGHPGRGRDGLRPAPMARRRATSSASRSKRVGDTREPRCSASTHGP